MTQDVYYVVCLVADGQRRFVLWKDGGSEPDRYVTLPRSSGLAMSNTERGLAKLARRHRLPISEQEPHTVDLDAMRRALAAMRPGKPISQRTARILLECWNALEDMARSLQVPFEGPTSKRETQAVYDKLFYGNNLPSITPADLRYQPLFTDRERSLLRSVLRRAWREIGKHLALMPAPR